MPATHHITLWGLEVFITVAETGSISAASEQLSVSSATVSQQITNLEGSLGLKLLDRVARPIVPTPAGLIALQSAQGIINDIRLLKARLTDWNIAALPRLRFAMIDEFEAGVTPDLAGELTRIYQGGSFEMWSGGSRDCLDALRNRDADIVVVARFEDVDDTYECHDLIREQFVLVTSKDLIQPGDDSHSILNDSQLVRYARHLPMARMIEAHLARLKLQQPRTLEFDSSYSIFAALKHCKGWALSTPLSYAHCQRFHGDVDIMKLPFSGLSRTVTLLARKDELGDLPQQFATLFRKLIRKHYFAPGILHETIGDWMTLMDADEDIELDISSLMSL